MPKVPNNPVSLYDRKLIEEVKKRGLLWDRSNKFYRHCKLTNDAYNEIAIILKAQFDVELDSKSVRVDWKRIRDCHRKGKNKIINNDPSKQPTPKELCLQELCSFVLPFIKSNNRKKSSEPLKHKELLNDNVNVRIQKQQTECFASTSTAPKKSTLKCSPFTSTVKILESEMEKENTFSNEQEIEIDGVFPNFENYVGNSSIFSFNDDNTSVKPMDETTAISSSLQASTTNTDHEYIQKEVNDGISPFEMLTTNHDSSAEKNIPAFVSPFGTLKTNSVVSGHKKRFQLESLANPGAKSKDDKNNFLPTQDYSFKRKYEKRSCSDNIAALKKSISEFKQFQESSTTKVLLNSYVNLLMDEFKMLPKDIRSLCFDELLDICESYKKRKM